MVLSALCRSLPAGALVLALLFPQQAAIPLGEVQVTGTMRFTPADVLKISGLKIGQPMAGPDFESVARQMAATGMFQRVGYRYASNASGRWVLTFEIEDLNWNVPVAFDNFIWFSDDELTKAVRESIPSFAGTLPSTPEVSGLMTATLQRLLKTRGVAGRVEFMAEGTVGSQALKGYLFRVVEPAPPVCVWTFNGASGIQSKDLEAELTAAGRSYSRTFVTRASKGTLTNLYRRLGYWRASVGEPLVALAKSAECDGVSVTMAITEGAKYQWAGAEWTGNAAMTPDELNKALGMKAGAPAGITALEEGLRRIASAYGRKGYVAQRATFAERLDDAARAATFAIAIDEGAQYRMGTVSFTGVPPGDAAELARRWRLKSGDVYDAEYPTEFYSKEIVPRVPRGTKPPQRQTAIDTPQRLVHVRYVFGG